MNPATTQPVEEWEQFFVEKSRRRREKVRRRDMASNGRIVFLLGVMLLTITTIIYLMR